MSKKKLGVRNIQTILNLIPEGSRSLFDESLIERLYQDFQTTRINDDETIASLRKILHEKRVLVLAAGKTIIDNKAGIARDIKDKGYYVIHINSVKGDYPIDMLFVSNSMKADRMNVRSIPNIPIVTTSNIHGNKIQKPYVVDHSSLIGSGNDADNAGLMLLTLLSKIGVSEVALAGFDGFSEDSSEYIQSVSHSYLQSGPEERNENMISGLTKLSRTLDIKFITPSLYNTGMF